MKVADRNIGLILAAGYSSRAKGFKLLMDIQGKPVIERLVESMVPYVKEIVVVTGYRGNNIEEWMLQWRERTHYPIESIRNVNVDQGMFSSVKVGIEVISDKMAENSQIDHVLLTPGDYPCISKKAIEQLLYCQDDVVIPSYTMKAGHPVYIRKNVVKAIQNEPVESHLKHVLMTFNKQYVVVSDPGVLMDVDTPEQMAIAREYAFNHSYTINEKKEQKMRLNYVKNPNQNREGYETTLVDQPIMEEVMTCHKGYEQYHITPLVNLEKLASTLQIKGCYVKDESGRFGLNAFKVLGAAYAIGKSLARELGDDIEVCSFTVLKERVSKELPHLELSATTDGNHGRGVAWIGKQLGIPVHIYMPKGTTKNRADHIRKLDAEVTITDLNYDDTVRFVVEKSQQENWLVIQDTAWEGYEDVPVWIMQGYATIAKETVEQLGDTPISHVFLQAGVGAFAGIIAEALYDVYQERCPKIYVVEAESANCYYASAIAGEDVVKSGDLTTIMAGLACGEQNPIGNKILKRLVDGFFSAPDWVSANGMRILGLPVKGDTPIVSGESGAVSMGVIETLLTQDSYASIRDEIGLNEDSQVLLFSTEGDTDVTVYREITWHGAYAMPEQ